MERGGRLVLAVSEAYGPLRVEPAAGPGAPEKVFPALAGRAALEAAGPRAAGRGTPLDAHAVFALGRRRRCWRALAASGAARC